MKSKKIIFVCAGILIFLIIFSIFYYKKTNTGNNISKSIKDFKEYILNISSYEATVSVEVISNKNTNRYILKQYYESPNYFKQEVEAPENIKGLITLYDGSNLQIENSRLDLTKIYNNYNCLSNNLLSLNGFMEDCKKNEPQINETENEVILEITNENKYTKYKRLVIDKHTGLPTKMEIMDENKKALVYILYNEIVINCKIK